MVHDFARLRDRFRDSSCSSLFYHVILHNHCLKITAPKLLLCTLVWRDVISQNELASFLDTLICIMKGLYVSFSILGTFGSEICNLKLQVDYTFL